MVIEDSLDLCRKLISVFARLREQASKRMDWDLVCEANDQLAELYELEKELDSRVARLHARQGR